MEKQRLVDFENHYIPESFVNMMKGRSAAPRYDEASGLFYMQEGAERGLPMLPGLFGVEQRLADMDKAGIDVAVISGAPMVEQLEGEEGIAAARLSNNEVAALQRRYPGRFRGCACLPIHDVAASVLELRRCRDELGLDGWLTFSSSGRLHADDPEMLPIFAQAEALGMFVYIHPAHSDYPRLYGCGGGLSSAGLGFTVDACVSIMRMITQGVFDRLPGLKVIIGHLGEGLPFIMERMDRHIGGGDYYNAGKNLYAPSWYFKRNIWVTTGGNNSPEAFACAKQVLGADRILFSTDYPFEPLEKTIHAFSQFPMSKKEREQVGFLNGEALLKL